MTKPVCHDICDENATFRHMQRPGRGAFFSSTRAEEPLSGLPRIDYSAGTLRDACGFVWSVGFGYLTLPRRIFMTTNTLSIATIAGDGTGPEVTAEAIVLDAVARLDGFEFTAESDWGGDRYLRTGEIIPEGGLDLLRSKDAVFGCNRSPDVPGIRESLLLELRFKLDQYINLAPRETFTRSGTPLANRGPDDTTCRRSRKYRRPLLWRGLFEERDCG